MHPERPRRAHILPWALAAAALHALLIAAITPSVSSAVDVPRLGGLAWAPQQRWDDPADAGPVPAERLAEDLRLIAEVTGHVRTYTQRGLEAVPALAARAGLTVTAGAWLGHGEAADRAELDALEALESRHRNVVRLVVGNETLLAARWPIERLVAALERVRARSTLPVSTAEPWHVWLEHPQLADHVDYLMVHLLPYWEGVPAERAVEHALGRLAQLRAAFPGKPIVVGEFGWPSAGSARGAAHPSPEAQARVVREFAAHAQRSGLDAIVIEAFDQPWKRRLEGAVGPHWGVFDAARTPKFALTGPIEPSPGRALRTALAAALGVAIALLAAPRTAHWTRRARIGFVLAAQAIGAFAVVAASAPAADYAGRGEWLVHAALLAPALLLAVALLVAQALEACEIGLSAGTLRRHIPPTADGSPPAAMPFASLHLACASEPPAMVIAAIDRLLALDWPAFEVIVVDNNTADAALWRPVRRHCERLARTGRLVRFERLPHCPGFKAQALNHALRCSDPRTRIVGVVDADYLVAPDWLRVAAAHFAAPGTVLVQAPQAHRDWQASAFDRMANREFEGFFRIGMHHRDQRNAIVQHGTMTLVRAEALRAAGGWDERCVCEDTELGLRLLRAGGEAVYVDRVLGTGLVPADFDAWRRQRTRWARGAVQILRRHRTALLRGGGGLDLGQRLHFLAGWLPWVADAAHLVFTGLAIAASLAFALAPEHVSLPAAAFAAPALAMFVTRLALTPLLYATRVRCGAVDTGLAMLGGLALSHAVARGVFAGLRGGPAHFEVTRKAAAGAASGPRSPVREEAALLGLLALGLIAVHARVPAGEALAWTGIVLLQALPYAAAIAAQGLSRRRRAAGAKPARRRALATPAAQRGGLRRPRASPPRAPATSGPRARS